MGTAGGCNLRAGEKLRAVRAHCGSAGDFAYIGNSHDDVPLWETAAEAFAVSPAPAVARRAARTCRIARTFESPTSRLRALVKVMRPYQWVKNVLLLIPLATAHKVGDHHLLLQAILGVVVFSLCASGVYVGNDLLDIEADRRHHRKRRRPLASGALSIPAGIALTLLLLAAPFAISVLLLPWRFTALLGAYWVISTSYSGFFKRRLLQDVFMLAGLYTLRIFAGGAAVGVPVSQWLLAFSMFCFLSLALLKRYSEMLAVEEQGDRQASGRSYVTDDLHMLASCGPAAGYAAVMVFCLYINSEAVRPLYRRPDMLWIGAPVLLYWFTRIWFLARRRLVTDDPILFAIRDKVSWVAGGLMAVAAIVASM
jgi:4-hydroxybenzoate polyprenyltransferase